MRLEPARWLVLAGIALWLWMLPATIEESMNFPDHHGIAGRWPMLNFPGPKVHLFPIATALARNAWWSVSEVSTAAWGIIALWLITTPGISGLGARARRLQRLARWCPILLAGAVVGAGLSLRLEDPSRVNLTSRMIALCIILIETPATVLVYLHLANVAAICTSARLAKHLRLLACATGAMALLPLIAFALMKYTRPHHYTPLMGGVCAAYGALALATACLAVMAVLQFAWALASGREMQPSNGPIPESTG